MKLNKNILEDIYNEYNIMVYNLALHYTQCKEDAEEITQDVFLQVFQSLENFKQKASLKTWIYRITINKSLDFLKYKNSSKRLFIFGKKIPMEQKELINKSNHEHPGILLVQKENSKILFSAINQLPENLKSAFILSKIDGLTNKEISEIMEISISATESLIYRAKQSLIEKLSQKFEDFYKKK